MMRILAGVALVLAAQASGGAQSPSPSPPLPAASPSPAASPWATASPASTPSASPADTRDDYRLGPGDVLEITVLGNADLSRTATVQPSGSITFPLLNEVAVAGLTEGWACS